MTVDKALEIAKFYNDKYLVTLDRLHQCKRRNREDKVKLRNVIEDLEESVRYWEDSSEYWFGVAYPEE